MIKSELIEQIEKSKITLREHIKKEWLEKNKISQKIKKILEWEPYDIQLITNLHYIDWCSIEEISEITNKSETLILNYFQLILFKIKLVLDFNEKKEHPFSVSNYKWNKSKNNNNENNWWLLDIKT